MRLFREKITSHAIKRKGITHSTVLDAVVLNVETTIAIGGFLHIAVRLFILLGHCEEWKNKTQGTKEILDIHDDRV